MDPDLKVDREQCIRHIRKAYKYNAAARSYASCNQLYLGSMSQAYLCRILGVTDFRLTTLRRARSHQLQTAVNYLEEHAFPWDKVKKVKLPEEKI